MADTTAENFIKSTSPSNLAATALEAVGVDTYSNIVSDPDAALQAFRRDINNHLAPRAPFVSLLANIGFIGFKAQNVMKTYMRFITEDPTGAPAIREDFYRKLKAYKGSDFVNFHAIDFNKYGSIPVQAIYTRAFDNAIPLEIDRGALKDATKSLEELGTFIQNIQAQLSEGWTSHFNEIARHTIGDLINNKDVRHIKVSDKINEDTDDNLIADIVRVQKDLRQDNHFALSGVENSVQDPNELPLIITTTRTASQVEMSKAIFYHNDLYGQISDYIIEDNYFLKYVNPEKRAGIKALVLSPKALQISVFSFDDYNIDLPRNKFFTLSAKQINSYFSAFEPVVLLDTKDVGPRFVPVDSSFVEVYDDGNSNIDFVYDDFEDETRMLEKYNSVKHEFLLHDDKTNTDTVIGSTPVAVGDVQVAASDTPLQLHVMNASPEKGDGAGAYLSLYIRSTYTKTGAGEGETKQPDTVDVFTQHATVYFTLRVRKAQNNFGI